MANGEWVLMAIRRSGRYDFPGVSNLQSDVSRFVLIVDTEEVVTSYFNTFSQPTEIIAAEVRNPDGKIVMCFDHIAEVIKKSITTDDEFLIEVGRAALGLTVV